MRLHWRYMPFVGYKSDKRPNMFSSTSKNKNGTSTLANMGGGGCGGVIKYTYLIWKKCSMCLLVSPRAEGVPKTSLKWVVYDISFCNSYQSHQVVAVPKIRINLNGELGYAVWPSTYINTIYITYEQNYEKVKSE